MKKFKDRLPIILSATALVVALGAGTPAIALTIVDYARNADKVDKIHASKKPSAGKLLPLNSSKRLPAGVASFESLEGASCTWGTRTGRIGIMKYPFSVVNNPGWAPSEAICFFADQWEANDTSTTPRNIGTATAGSASIYPAGNDDWYVTTASTTCLRVASHTLEDRGSLTIHFYKNGVELIPNSSDDEELQYCAPSASAATWMIHVDAPKYARYTFSRG